MELPQDEQATKLLPASVVTMITTEHFNLQSGRSKAFSEVIARASIFVGGVSTTLVALAFIGQISHLGSTFFMFSLILFPSLVFLGVANFEGILQAMAEDVLYTLGTNRIRHFYLEQAPQLQPYLILPAYDDLTGFWNVREERFSWWQLFITPAGLIGVLNSILVGVCIGMLLYVLMALPLLPYVMGGTLAFLLSIGIHQRYQSKRWRELQQRHFPLFPSQPGSRS